MLRSLLSLLALALFVPAPALAGEPCAYLDVGCQAQDADSDDDGIADIVEGSICGREVLSREINRPYYPGHCASTMDLIPPSTADTDGDGLPEDLEALLCGLEDRNHPEDGTCTGYSYDPPL